MTDAHKKTIGLFGVFSIASGAMISSGLFVLPGMAYNLAGPAVVISYAIAGIMIVPAMLAMAELATAMPKSGGDYFFVERTIGPLAGTLAGFLDWFAIGLKAAFALVGIGAAVVALFPDLTDLQMILVIRVTAAVCCVIFTLLNLRGSKEAVNFQNVLVVVLVSVVLFYIFSGGSHIGLGRFSDFWGKGWGAIISVAGMVFVSYGGLTKVAAVADEVKDPGRNLPRGMILSFIVVNALYLAAIMVTIGIVPSDALSESYAPLVLGASGIMGDVGALLLEIAALTAFITTANAGILASSRAPLAMSLDGLLPEWFSRTTTKSVPKNAILITGAIMLTLIVLLDIEDLVKTASTMMILMFAFINVSLVIMRKARFQSYRPTFHCPGYPYLQIVAVMIYLFLITQMGTAPVILTLMFAVAACAWYLGYVRKKIDREGALAYLIKQTFDDSSSRAGIEDELVRMALERDAKDMDRFDHLVRDCSVIDIEERLTGNEFFERIANELSGECKIPPERLNELFLDRERNSSTVISPGLAIPHLMIAGEEKFVLAMIRAREGVYFDELHEPVRVAFALIGTEDERNFHLKCLMNIAHIVQEPEFRERWLEAATGDQLRDLVMLTRRNRS